MDIRQIQYFLTIAEEGTISAAAKKLNISQPPLSAQMRQLEEELGIKLFERGARQITLTEAGRMLHRYASEMIELEHTAHEEISNLRTGKKGSVRIGFVSSCYCAEVFRGLNIFHEQVPDVELKIFEANTFELLEMLSKEQIELAFIRSPYPSHNYDSVFIRHDSMCVSGLKDKYPLLAADSLSLSDLNSQPLITYRRREQLIRNAFAEINQTPRIVCLCDDARTCLMLAQEGYGLALTPESITDWYSPLASLPILNDGLANNMSLIKRKDTLVSQSANLLFTIYQDIWDGVSCQF